jgi:hypothetical protein
MPKGKVNEYKVRLVLNRDQKALWKGLEESHKVVVRACQVEFLRSEDPTMCMILSDRLRMGEMVPDFPLEATSAMVAQVASTMVGVTASLARSSRFRRALFLPVSGEDIVFSIEDDLVSLPYGLRTTRYIQNKKATLNPRLGHHVWKAAAMSAASWHLTVVSNDPTLVMRIPDEVIST